MSTQIKLLFDTMSLLGIHDSGVGDIINIYPHDEIGKTKPWHNADILDYFSAGKLALRTFRFTYASLNLAYFLLG